MDAMSKVNKATICPVCGFDLGFEPWKGPLPSHEDCPSCGIEFGYHDTEAFHSEVISRSEAYKQWRQKWIGEGMKWSSSSKPPSGWDPIEQLRRIGVDVGGKS